MKNNNDIRLYNVMFPLWMLILFPMTWLVVIPANFIIDSVVLLITIKCLKLDNMKLIYKKSILKVFLFGFLADFVGGLIMLLSQFIPYSQDNWWYENMTNAIAFNPFENVFSFIYVLIATSVAGYLIYLFNYKFSFKNLEIELAKKKRIALSIAIFTAPYLFFFPSRLLY